MPSITDVDTLLDAAIAHHQAGRTGPAEAAYREILATDPDQPDALNLLGLILQDQGNYTEAVTLIGRALDIDPDFPEALTNLARARRTTGDVDSAVELARRAIALEPEMAEAYFQLGRALLDLQRNQEAVASLQRATELDPALADAHASLGNAQMRMNEFAAATAAFKAALDRNPEQIETLVNIGACLLKLGRLDDALVHQRHAMANAPDDPIPHAGIAASLQMKGDIQGSMEAARRAVGLAPDYHDGWIVIGNNHIVLGQFQDAEAAFRTALSLSPDSGSARAGLAGIGRGNQDQDELARLEARLRDTAASDYERASAGYALGILLDRACRYDEAFQAYAEANKFVLENRRAAGQVFDLSMVRRHIAWARQTFTPDVFAATRGWGDPSDRPVFVVGMPRSGTTLVEQIAASHPRVHGAGELKKVPALIRNLDKGQVHLSPLEWDRDRVGVLAGAHVAELTAFDPNAIRTIDKLPDNIQLLGQIAVLFPSARIIVCRRDPRDVCLSCYFQNFGDGNEWSFDLASCAIRARQIEDLLGHWREVVPLQILEVEYETLVGDLEGQSRRLIDFMGLEWDESCLSFHETARPVMTASQWQVRQPLYATSVGRWRHYQAHLGPMLAGLDGLIADAPDGLPATRASAEAFAALARTHLLSAGLDEAIHAAREAIRCAPDWADGYALLGLSLLQLDRPDEAMVPLRDAIRLAPDWINPRIDLAASLTRLKDHRPAADTWRQVVSMQPDNLAHLGALTSELRELEQYGEALETIQRLVALAPDNPRLRAEEAIILVGLQKPDKAETALRQAIALAPDEAEYYYGLGEVLCMLGRFAEAALNFKRSARSKLFAARAQAGLASIGDTGTDDLNLGELLKIVSDAAADGSVRATAGFALAKALDRSGAYDEAFEHAVVANRLIRAQHSAAGRETGLDNLRQYVTATIARSRASTIRDYSVFGDKSELPVFIVGMPRSGTSLVEQIAASHPAVFGLGESKAIKILVDDLEANAIKLGRAAWTPRDIRDRSAAHVAALRATGGGALRITNKMPDNLQYLAPIATLFPGARVIMCRRDLRDVGLSCFMTNFTDGMEWAFDLADIGRRAYEMERLTVHWRYELPLKLIEVQYEDLVADLEGQSRRLIDFLGLDWDPACLSFHKTQRAVMTASQWQVRQPLYDSSIGRWRHYRKYLAPLIEPMKGLVPAD